MMRLKLPIGKAPAKRFETARAIIGGFIERYNHHWSIEHRPWPGRSYSRRPD